MKEEIKSWLVTRLRITDAARNASSDFPRDRIQQFSRADDRCHAISRFGKLPLVAGDNIIGPRCLRALQELGVARVYRSRQGGSRVIEFALLADQGEDGSDLVGWKRKFRAREHSRIFFEHLVREAGMHQALMTCQDD